MYVSTWICPSQETVSEGESEDEEYEDIKAAVCIRAPGRMPHQRVGIKQAHLKLYCMSRKQRLALHVFI